MEVLAIEQKEKNGEGWGDIIWKRKYLVPIEEEEKTKEGKGGDKFGEGKYLVH